MDGRLSPIIFVCFQSIHRPQFNFLHLHLSFNRGGRWDTTLNYFTTSFSLFSTALWDLVNSRPVHSQVSSHLLACLPCLHPLSLCLLRWF